MQNPGIEKRGLSVKEVCDSIGCGHSTFYKIVAAGLLVVRKLGGRTIVLPEDLDRFLAALPVANAEIKPPGAADHSDNLNRTDSASRSPKVMEQRPAVVSSVPPGKVRSQASPPGRSRSATVTSP
jgi:hypothetical protein